MRRSRICVFVLTGLVALLAVSCGSESAETQALYTDAQKMYDDIEAAFKLAPNSQERIDAMRQIISEEWDTKLVANLEKYLKEAPNGKYAQEAKDLLAEAGNSMHIKMLGQIRPLMQQTGLPETPSEADSMVKSLKTTAEDTLSQE